MSIRCRNRQFQSWKRVVSWRRGADATGRGTFGHISPTLTLLLFATGARRIPLSLVGLLQYTAPTIQFMLGIFLYHEPFSAGKLVGFVLIYSGKIYGKGGR